MKPVIAIDVSSTGLGGGPHRSSIRIMRSGLQRKYDFYQLTYRTELGRFISVKRIQDLRKQIRKIKPDIVHFTGLQLSGFHLAMACKLEDVPHTIVTLRGFSGDMIYFSPLKKFFTTWIFELCTLFMTTVIYGNSKYSASRRLVRLFSKKVYGHIYNFPPTLSTEFAERDIRKELGIPKDVVVATSVARINREKGYHILKDAILKVRDLDRLVFLIVGEGSYLEEMKAELSSQFKDKRIHFLGLRADVQDILRVSDAFILPTLHETLSVALLEASQESLPLIASDTGGVPEIVRSGYNGILVRPGDANDLANAIRTLHGDSELRTRYGMNSKERLKTVFSIELIEKQIDEIYTMLLNS
jgi:glycosyltransferase involved in cell wall biosynthesis